MKTQYILFICVFGVMLSCSSSKTKATPEQIQALDHLVQSESFVIESEWALPFVTNSMIAVQNSGLLGSGNSANRISLLDIPNRLKLTGDSISSELPYFGEVQMPTGYMNSDTNDIVFKGNVKNYKVIQNKNSSYSLHFDAKSNTESYDVTITLFPSLRSEMILRGAKRNPIRYTGYVRATKE